MLREPYIAIDAKHRFDFDFQVKNTSQFLRRQSQTAATTYLVSPFKNYKKGAKLYTQMKPTLQ